MSFLVKKITWVGGGNNYSARIAPERRTGLQTRFNQKIVKDTSKTRSFQNILRRLSDNGLLVKLTKRKGELSAYSIEYQIPFLLVQQWINEDFVQLNLDTMRIKVKLYGWRVEY